MSASAILTAIYAVVTKMTVANGYSADWVVHKGDDMFFTEVNNPRFNAVVTSEENIDRSGGGDQTNSTDIMEVEFNCRIPMDNAGINPSQVPYETMKDVLSGVEDVKVAFDNCGVDAVGICAAGAFDWWYEGHTTELIEEEDKYNTIKVVMTYQFKYRTLFRRR